MVKTFTMKKTPHANGFIRMLPNIQEADNSILTWRNNKQFILRNQHKPDNQTDKNGTGKKTTAQSSSWTRMQKFSTNIIQPDPTLKKKNHDQVSFYSRNETD